jgi:hypothetical protein
VFDERALAERFGAKPRSIHEAPVSANPKARTDVWLYVANLALLATHQADAAYWHEWDVLGVPGGLPFFLLFTVAAVALLGTGLVRVAEGRPRPGVSRGSVLGWGCSPARCTRSFSDSTGRPSGRLNRSDCCLRCC